MGAAHAWSLPRLLSSLAPLHVSPSLLLTSLPLTLSLGLHLSSVPGHLLLHTVYLNILILQVD